MLDNYDDYKTGGTHKVFSISVVGENITITNENLRTESIVLDEELCSSTNLKFGSCGTSKFTAEIANVFENFEGKLINVTVTMDNEVTKYGTFKVFSDKPIADRIFRSLTAYDAMNDIIKTNVLSWYKSLTFPMTLKNFRDSFFNYLGITQETTTLVNDNFIIPGGFTASDALMGGTIITAICELNGVFGHINRDGKFEYIDLTQSESFECPPYENGSVTYEDYVTSPITKVTMRGTASDVGTSVGVAGNEYIIQGNPLIYGTEGTQALTTAITNLLNKIKTIVFRPFDLRKTIGNPCVEIGDAITIDTKYETVNSYVLRRTLTGIQALRDRYSALGSKVYPAEATSYQNEITRSKGKMHEFEVTLEGFSSRVTEVESDVEGLDSDLHTNYSTTSQMNSTISQTADTIRSEVSQTYVNQTTYNAEVQRLQDEIDGAIESYTGSAVPTLNNYPANEWTTTTERDKHLGDLYLVNASGGSYAGFYYRFDKSGSTYSWVHIPDNEVQKALADAAEANQKAEAAQATADGIADNLSDNYSTTQQMNSAINQKADEITQTVSTTYETKSDATSKLNTANTNAQGYATQAKNEANASTDTKLTKYYTKTQTDSAINQKANEITLNVSENYTTKTEFSNLEIGGRNLLYRMRYSNAEFHFARAEDIAFDDYTYCMTATGADMYVYNVGDSGASYNASNGALIPIKAGDSVYIKTYDMINATSVFRKNYITLWNANKVSLGYTYFNKAEGVYTVPEGSQAAYMSFRFGYATAVTGTRYKVRVKIERGNKPTDWSPAPEDVDEKKGLRNYFLCFRSSASTYPNRFVAFNDSYEYTLADYQNTGSFTRFWNLTVPMSTFLNRTVRLSFDAISPNGATGLNVYNNNGNPKYNMGYYPVIPNLTTSWQHYSIPITVTESSDSGASIEWSDKIEFYAPSQMGVKIRNVKLEMNATETAWTLAPEDETNTKEAQGYANTAQTNAVNTAKSYTDAQLQITSSSILSTVEQGYTTKTEFNNLQIGGENVLEYSKNFELVNTYIMTQQGAITTNAEGFTEAEQRGNGTSWIENYMRLYLDATDKSLVGKDITISIDFKTNDISKIGNMFCSWGSQDASGTRVGDINIAINSYKTVDGSALANNKWTRIYYTFRVETIANNSRYYIIQFKINSSIPSGTSMYYRKPKVEIGNRPTDWSPALYDIQPVGTNLLRYAPKSKTPTSYLALSLNLTEKLVKGQTYTLQLWDIDISHTGKQASELNVSVYAGGGNNILTTITGFTNGHADYKVATFTVSSDSQLDNLWLNIYNSVPNASGTLNLTIGRWKLEKGNKATEWQMNPIDASSKSEVQQLSNMVAVKVNSSGRLVTAALGVDPASSTSYVKVKADDLDIIANGNLQLTAKTLGIDSTYFKVSNTGVITATSGTIGGFTISETAIQAETGGSTHGLVIQALKTTNYDAIAYAIRVRNSSSDAWTYPFIVRWNGHTTMTNANVTGTIRATAGAVGGWKIQSWGLYDDKADTSGNLGAGLTKYGSGPAFWAGSDLNHINTAPFRVLHDGTLCTSNLLATGGTIANWTINAKTLEQKNTSVNAARIGWPGGGDNMMLAVGEPSNNYIGADFRVDITGNTIAKSFTATEQAGYWLDLSTMRVGIDKYNVSGYNNSDTRTFHLEAANGTLWLTGSLFVDGSKYRVVETENYSKKLLNCYETPTPMFGDVGEGKIAEDGKCYVWLDSAFSETIKTESYQVFLQKYGQGECYVAERTKRYFVVKGDAGLNFAWELKARQAGFENNRLETFNEELDAFYKTTDYGEKAISHLGTIKDEREVA